MVSLVFSIVFPFYSSRISVLILIISSAYYEFNLLSVVFVNLEMEVVAFRSFFFFLVEASGAINSCRGTALRDSPHVLLFFFIFLLTQDAFYSPFLFFFDPGVIWKCVT